MSDPHPIIQSLSLSAQQQAAIAGLEGDALITAGAGTGKTRTLTARYLQLLASGTPLRSIVAITFTRKAAREMRNRIRQEVWDYLACPGLSDDERGQWRRIANELDAAHISTIHGLCQEILRTHPAKARVDPDFQTMEESKTILVREEAVEDALFWASGQVHLAGLLALVDEKIVREAVRTLLGKGSEARRLLQKLPADDDGLLAAWGSWLAQAQMARLSEIMADSVWRQAREIIETATPKDRNDKLALQCAAAVAGLRWLDDVGEGGRFREGVRILGGLNLSGGRQAAWPGGKEQVKALKEVIKNLRTPFKQDAWLGETLNEEDARVARALTLLKTIALQAFTIYQARKDDMHVLDFDDLEDRAIRLLADHAEARLWWQSQVQALLVDEFQDTNARQTELLEMLDGGRGRLFLVGDAKQSIYRFRGADVAVFQVVRGDFLSRGKRVAPLDETWRAHQALVHGLNDLLAPVLGEARQPWEAPFEALQPARPRGPDCKSPHYIEFLLAAGKLSDGARSRAAQAVALRLQELMAEGKCTPGDVVILTRASTSFADFEDAFDEAGIPFLTLAGRGFHQRPEIRDLVVVMRAAADPTDDVALAGALRSPGLGLSDTALTHLAFQRDALRPKDRSWTPALWDALTRGVDAIPEMERPRAERARNIITRLNNMAGRVTVADLLKRYLDETDYLAILAGAGQDRAARNVAKLLDDMQRAGFVQVAEFTEYVRLARTTAVREGEAPVVAEGAVQIMSVHRAKGLEFPIVVLGDVSRQPRGRDGLIMAGEHLGWKLPLPPGEEQGPVFYEALKRLETRQEEAEEKRLLYVAATRAQEYLLISGVAAPRGWLKLLAAAIPLDESCLDKDAVDVVQQTHRLSPSGTLVQCTLLGSEWTPAEMTFAAAPASPHTPGFHPDMINPVAVAEEALDDKRKAAEIRPERRVWRVTPPEEQRAWAPAWVVGTLIHRAIELERFPEDPLFDDWLLASARGLGLSDVRVLKNALGRARRTLIRLQESALWHEMIAADRRIHEIPYDYIDDDHHIDRGKIDIAFQKDGRWTLVDFKTDRVKDRQEMLAQIEKKKYREQVQRYIRAMQRILGESPAALLCFLDVGGQVMVDKMEPSSTDDQKL